MLQFFNECLQVEDTLFKLPRHHVGQSPEFSHYVFDGTTSDENVTNVADQVIHLEGVGKIEFRLMLTVIFSESLWGKLEPESANGGDTNRPVDPLPSWKDWASVLELSTQLHVETVRKTAIQQLSSCPSNTAEWIAVLRMATEDEAEIRETARHAAALKGPIDDRRFLLLCALSHDCMIRYSSSARSSLGIEETQ